MPEVQAIPAPKTEPVKTSAEKKPLPEKKKDNETNLCLQTKLTVGAPDDPFEKEADSVADSIMRMPQQNFAQRKCTECEKEEKEQVQLKPISQNISDRIQTGEGAASSASNSINNKIISSKGNGQSMDSNTQSFMQNSFGADFSNVKIHTDSESIQMSRELNAKAFTTGNDIYFNVGQYQPNSNSGKHLLAHELTHVLQQSPNEASTSVIQRKETVVPEMDSVPEWKASGDREFQWQNKGLRDIIYPEREQSLRAFLEIVKELELSGSLDPMIGSSDKATIKKDIAAYVEKLKKMDHDALVFETMEVFKKFKNTPFFPDWVRYTVIHYSGMRYESAHSTWVAPQGLLAILKERERIEADDQHKNFMSAKGRKEFDADPKLSDITDKKKKKDYIAALNAAQPSVVEKKLSAADKAIYTDISKKENEWYELTFALSGENDPTKAADTLKKIKDNESEVNDLDAKLSDKGRKLVVTARKKRLELFQRIHIEVAKERLRGLSEEEALFLLSKMHEADEIPDPVWKEIVSFTQLRIELTDATELVNKKDRMLKGVKESDKITKDQIGVWKVLLKMWYESSGGTKWREDHRLTLSPSIVTSLVCDQLGSKAQNIRGVKAPGGLRGNAQAFFDAAKKSTASAAAKWDGKTACSPAPASPFFKIPQQIEDFPCGTSIFWANWSDLNVTAEYGKVYDNEEKPLLTNIKKLKTEKEKLNAEKAKNEKDKKGLEDEKKKIIGVKNPATGDKNRLKRIDQDLKKMATQGAVKDKRLNEIAIQLPLEEKKLAALKKKINSMEVFLPEKDKTPDYSNTFVPFDSPDLEMKEDGKSITDGMKDKEGWTYSVNDKRLVAGHPTKKPDKDKPPVNIPVKTIMRVRPNPFYCPGGEKSCPLDFSENKNKKLIKQWMIWRHEATVMFVMPNTQEIITYDTAGTFDKTKIKGMSAQRRSLNSLLHPDKGHRIFVGFAPEGTPNVDPAPFLDEKKILKGNPYAPQPSITQPSPSSTIPVEPPPVVQPKLQMGRSNDIYEKQADDIAQRVVNMPFVQRKCAHCEEEEKKETKQVLRKSFIQTKAESEPSVSDSLSQSIESSKGSGSPMDDSTQTFMSERFGADFSHVKIHNSSEAVQMNQQLNAKAFTTGNDIYFNEGEYQPHSDSGKQLLAHELTHTIQQNGSFVQRKKEDKPVELLGDRPIPSSADIKDVMSLFGKTGFGVAYNFYFIVSGNTLNVYDDKGTYKSKFKLNRPGIIEVKGYYVGTPDSKAWRLIDEPTPGKYDIKGFSEEAMKEKARGSKLGEVVDLIDEELYVLGWLSPKDILALYKILPTYGKYWVGMAVLNTPVAKTEKEEGSDRPKLSMDFPDWFKELKAKVETKIEEDRKANKDNPYLPDKIYFYGSDKVQEQKGKDAWTIEVEKGDKEAYYTILKTQWDDAANKNEFTDKVTAVLYEKVQLMLTKEPTRDDKEIYEIDGSGGEKNKFKDGGDKPLSNPFIGLKKEQLEKLQALIKQLIGDTKPDEKTPPPKIPLSSNDIKALLQLADDPNKDKIIEYLKVKTGKGVSSTKTIEELVVLAKIKDAYERFNVKTDGKGDRPEPVISRPVQGVIIQHDPLIVSFKPVSFGFEVRNDVSALRVPWIFIRWFAYTDVNKNNKDSPAPKDWKKDDWVNYMPTHDEGLMNNKHFKLEFPAEGIYTIEAIVDHNYFLPNHFRTSVKVLDEQKVLKEKEKKVYKGFLKEGATTKEDFGQLSYGEGTVTRGKLDEKFQGAKAEEQLKVIDEEITRIKGVIEEYKKKKTSEGDAMVEWGEKYLEKLQSNRDNIAKTNEDKSQSIVACRGTYISRTEGVKTADLKLSCFIKKDINIVPPSGEFDEGSEEEGYRVTLYDYTQLYENDNYSISVFGTTSEIAMKRAFSQLSEAYLDGHISLAFQKWDDATNKKTDEYIKYTRVTDTIGKKIKKVAFSTPANIAVNVVAAVLSVFPPTTGIGIAIGILYNGAQTISELQEQADKGTLTGKKVMIGCGSMLLDILPILGTAGKAAKIIRVGTKAYYVVEGIQLAGQALLVYETGMEQVEKLRTDYFVKIAELDDEIAMLKDTNPSDPQIDVLEKQREKLINDGRDATVKVLGEMVVQQAAFTVGGKLLHSIHEHYAAKSKLEARGKIADSLTGVEKLNEGERLALADKIYDNDVPIKAGKETQWKPEGDGFVLEIADNATHAEIDALLDKNPNRPSVEAPSAKPTGEADKKTGVKKEDVEKVSSSPIDLESKTPVTATNEVHEHFIHDDGTITRCSDRCSKLLDNTTDRSKDIQKIFGKDHANTKKAKDLKEKAKKLQQEAKDASSIKDKPEKQSKEKEILEKAKQLELELATLEKAMVTEIEGRIVKSMADIETFLEKYPEYKGEFERRIKNRNERKKEIATQLNDPDPTIKQQAIEELKNEERLAKKLLTDMKKHSDNMAKPDISKRYNYYETTSKRGSHVKVAEGELGVPGKVMKHRSQTEQAKVSAGSGDDAGHLIANIFGAEGGGRNLGKQNWIANEFGTWRQLEIMWAEKLLNGTKVSVKIKEVAKVKGERPFMREVTWTEIDPSGNVTHHELTFGNFETVKSRAATGAAPTVGIPEGGGIVFIWNKERAARGLEPVYSQQELQGALEYLHSQNKAENDVFTAANDNDEL
jgi:hypothetical protein